MEHFDTIDIFLAELEIVLDCKNQGYKKCMEKVKDLIDFRDETKVSIVESMKTFVDETDKLKEENEKLKKENDELKQQINKQNDYVETMEYETKIEQLESFNGGQEFWNDAEDVLQVLENDGFDEEEIKQIIEDKCYGYTYDIDNEELVKVQ